MFSVIVGSGSGITDEDEPRPLNPEPTAPGELKQAGNILMEKGDLLRFEAWRRVMNSSQNKDVRYLCSYVGMPLEQWGVMKINFTMEKDRYNKVMIIFRCLVCQPHIEI